MFRDHTALFALSLSAGLAGPCLAQIGEEGNRRSSLVQRAFEMPDRSDAPLDGFPATAVFPFEFRTIDGWGNNPDSPWKGVTGMPMVRMGPVAYDDGIGLMPARSQGPSARLVSNVIVAQPGSIPNEAGASDYLWQWGQFLDHDIDETPIASPAQPMDIPVPQGDPWFDPDGTGTAEIAFDRSAYSDDGGPYQQYNGITAFIDASNVYGSEHDRAEELRTLDGTGRLKTSDGGLLPFNVNGFHNAPTDHDPSYFLAGDIRANEQICLAAMHTLFVREHNHWAGVVAADDPSLDGNSIYERARAIVAAEMQAITYNEFLPMLLGDDAIPGYTGYDASVEPGIANAFATAAYRMGHTMLSPTLRRVGPDGRPIDAGHLPLAGAFFNPSPILDHGIDPYLRGLATQRAQKIDQHIIDDVRNFLFGQPGAGGFDLASLNIQRGRDHGVCGINELRSVFGLPAHQTFADLTPDQDLQADLALLYDTVNDIDPWVAMLSEPPAPGAMVGETLRTVLADQFTRLRDGDRFWYKTYMPEQLTRLIDAQTLAEIIRRNTGIGDELPDNVFQIGTCPADLTGDGVLDLADLQGFITAFAARDPQADMNLDGVYDLGDIQSFVAQFNAGCP